MICLVLISVLALTVVLIWCNLDYYALAVTAYQIFSSAFYGSVFHPVSDSYFYVQWADAGDRIGWIGTEFIVRIVYSMGIPSGGGGLLAGYLVFALIGAWGFILLDAAAKIHFGSGSMWRIYIFRAIMLLPVFHLWTASIGKDSLIFFAFGLFVFGAVRKGLEATVLVAMSVFLAFLIRPHIGIILIVGFLILNIGFNVRTLVLVSVLAIFPVFKMQILFDLVGIEALPTIQNLIEFLDMRAEENLGFRTSFNLSEYGIFSRVLIYLFSPMIAGSFLELALVFCNLILLIVVLVFLVPTSVRVFSGLGKTDAALLACSLAILLLLAYTTANVGIAIRQKAMVIPFLLLVMIRPDPKSPNLPDSLDTKAA